MTGFIMQSVLMAAQDRMVSMQGTSVVFSSTWLKGGAVIFVLTLTGCGGSSSGSSQPIKIDRVTPTQAKVNVPTEFTIEGDAAVLAQSNLSVSLTACKNLKLNSKAEGKLAFGCTPEQAGQQTLQLRNAQGNVLYQTNINFSLKPHIAAVTTVPSRMEVNIPTTIKMTGFNLSLGVTDPLFEGCIDFKKINATNTEYVFSCTPTQGGNKLLLVKSNAGEVLYDQAILVNPKVVITEIQPNTSSIRQTTTFTLKGKNFFNQADVSMNGCNADLVVHNRSLTEIVFSCTPTAVGTQNVNLQDDTSYVFASTSVDIKPFETAKSRWFGSGVMACGTATQNGVICSAAELGELFGLSQDGEEKIGRVTDYELVTNVEEIPNTPAILDVDKCIKDINTGMIWEQKTDDGGIRDKDWTYTWYQPNGNFNGSGKGSIDNPDAAAGSKGSVATCSGLSTQQATVLCNTEAYIKKLNDQRYCGYNTWQLPYLVHLESLTNLSQFEAAIHQKPFFNATAKRIYWTNTPIAEPLTDVWGVDFATGAAVIQPKDQAQAIRAVVYP
jgi:hypothetical protein